jgi:hypothetical protein
MWGTRLRLRWSMAKTNIENTRHMTLENDRVGSFATDNNAEIIQTADPCETVDVRDRLITTIEVTPATIICSILVAVLVCILFTVVDGVGEQRTSQ